MFEESKKYHKATQIIYMTKKKFGKYIGLGTEIKSYHQIPFQTPTNVIVKQNHRNLPFFQSRTEIKKTRIPNQPYNYFKTVMHQKCVIPAMVTPTATVFQNLGSK